MLRLRTFGGLWIRADVCPAAGAASQRRPLALLALLAAAGDSGLSRDKLLLYLWPESDQERGQNTLRQTLHSLRRDLQAPELFIGSTALRLNPLVITSDACDFADALAAGDIPRAADLYKGPFLDGFHITGAPDFERWVDEHRRQFTRDASAALERLAARALEEGDVRAAGAHLRRVAAMEPLDPAVAGELIRALVAAGDVAGALQHAKVHEAMVFEELGSELDPDVAALVARVRDGEFGSPARRSGPQRGFGSSSSGTTVPPEAVAPEVAPSLETPTPPPSSPRRKRAAVLLVLLIGVLAVVLFGDLGSEPLVANRVAIAPYQVLDSSLGVWQEGMADVISRNLDQAGPIRTVPLAAVSRRWRGRPDKESARDLGRLTGARFVIVGSLRPAGPDSVRATAMAVDASTGQVLREVERRQSVTRMDLLTDSLTVAILDILGERIPIGAFEEGSLSTVSSLEALKDFLMGEQFYRRSRWDSAAAYYRRALDKDSTFALALNHLGRVIAWQNLAMDSLSSAYLVQAGALNHGLSPRDSLLVLADSLSAGANATDSELLSWQLGRRLFRTLGDAVDRYPEAPEAWFALGDAQYHFGGGPIVGVPDSVALSSLARSIALDSAFGPAYLHAIELGLNVGDTALGLHYLRAYMQTTPARSAHRAVQLAQRLLDPSTARSAATRQLLDTLSADVLVSCRTILRRWPDSAETAVRLSRLLAERLADPGSPLPDTALMKQRLAEALAFRGHLREAATVAANRDLRIFAELAFLGAVPVDTARMVFRRWLREGSIHRGRALAWWSSKGDTAAIAEFLRMADRDLVEARTKAERLAASYASAAGKAHRSLAGGDTLEALGRFLALPDSLCPTCYLDRLTRARLLAARGDDRAALSDLSEPLHAFLTPLEVLYALERARVAHRLGESELARRDYGFVARAWRNGDLELKRRIARSEHTR